MPAVAAATIPRGAIHAIIILSWPRMGAPRVARPIAKGRTKNKTARTKAATCQCNNWSWLTLSCEGMMINKTETRTMVRFSLNCRRGPSSTNFILPMTSPITVTVSRPASCWIWLLTQYAARTSTISMGALRCGGTEPRLYKQPMSHPPSPPNSAAAPAAPPSPVNASCQPLSASVKY